MRGLFSLFYISLLPFLLLLRILSLWLELLSLFACSFLSTCACSMLATDRLLLIFWICGQTILLFWCNGITELNILDFFNIGIGTLPLQGFIWSISCIFECNFNIMESLAGFNINKVVKRLYKVNKSYVNRISIYEMICQKLLFVAEFLSDFLFVRKLLKFPYFFLGTSHKFFCWLAPFKVWSFYLFKFKADLLIYFLYFR